MRTMIHPFFLDWGGIMTEGRGAKKKRRERGKLNRGAKSEPQGFRGKRNPSSHREGERNLLHLVAHHLPGRRIDDRPALAETSGVRSAPRQCQSRIDLFQRELAIRAANQERRVMLGVGGVFRLALRQ